MSSLQDFDFSPSKFVDRSSVLFGESGTGKSFVMVDILHILKPYVEQIIVISPTDRQNHTYDKGIVPLPCIHYNITPKLLDDIWERQNALSTVYTKANKPEILKQLFDKIQGNSYARSVIDNIHRKRRDYEEEINNENHDESTTKAKIAEMDRECKKLIVLIYKHYI
jgi:ABC-type dipeptide/oligopeptide/nickel transport system ATPase component